MLNRRYVPWVGSITVVNGVCYHFISYRRVLLTAPLATKSRPYKLTNRHHATTIHKFYKLYCNNRTNYNLNYTHFVHLSLHYGGTERIFTQTFMHPPYVLFDYG
jgi:hypothetical protein